MGASLREYVDLEGKEFLDSDSSGGAVLVGAHLGPVIYGHLLNEFSGADIRVFCADKMLERWNLLSSLAMGPLRTNRMNSSTRILLGSSLKRYLGYIKSGGNVFSMIDMPTGTSDGKVKSFLDRSSPFQVYQFRVALSVAARGLFCFLEA